MLKTIKKSVENVKTKVKNTVSKVKEHITNPMKRRQDGIVLIFCGLGLIASGFVGR